MSNKKLTDKDTAYLKELAWKGHCLTDDYERIIFNYIGYCFQEYKLGKRDTKYVTKREILEYLCRKGLTKKKADGSLPDDRGVRRAARELLKKGLPVLATAGSKGYFIAETVNEIDHPQRENKAKATAMLAIDKGYDKARALIMGQTRLFM